MAKQIALGRHRCWWRRTEVLGLLGLGAFLWSMHAGQYDDLDGAASRIPFDNKPPAD